MKIWMRRAPFGGRTRSVRDAVPVRVTPRLKARSVVPALTVTWYATAFPSTLSLAEKPSRSW